MTADEHQIGVIIRTVVGMCVLVLWALPMFVRVVAEEFRERRRSR